MNNSINFSHLADLLVYDYSNKITHHTQDNLRDNNQSLDKVSSENSFIAHDSENEV